MTIIELTAPEFTTTICSSLTAYDISDNVDDFATSLTSIGTTISTNNADFNVDKNKEDVNETTAYVESLTDEELLELSNRLDEKEIEIKEAEVDQKVYKK